MIFNSSNGKKWRICKAKHYLRGGKETDIYYPIPESCETKTGTEVDHLPLDYEIQEMPRTKIPKIVRIKHD